MSTSSIEWTEATWNPIAGCTPVSPGCLNCYAGVMSYRLEKMGQPKYAGLTVLHNGRRTFNGNINFDEPALTIPLRAKKPTVYFVNSMSDLFHEGVPFDFVDKVFAVMALCPQHTFQVLTKRPARMAEYAANQGRLTSVAQAGAMMGYGEATMRFQWPLPNVWLGTSVEDQQRADERIPHLLKCPAAVRFLSCEPLLGALNIFNEIGPCVWRPGERNETTRGIDWVIVGGESGHGARECHTGLIEELVKQCRYSNVPVFVKQLGSKPRRDGALKSFPMKLRDKKGGDPAEWPEHLRVRQMPAGVKA